MNTHKLALKWKDNQATINAWLSLSDVFSAEIMAHCGFDSITIDMQHGVSDYSSAINILRVIQSTNTQALVRVPWLDPTHIMKILDAGASGIICPMINTKEDAKNLVKYSRYPCLGERSFGPIRAKFLYDNYHKEANNKILVIAMIETKEAIKNLDDILEVEGIDGIYIGPADLSFNLGKTPKFDQEDEEVLEQIKYILKKTKEKNKFIGIHNATSSYALKMTKLGFDFVSVGSDANFIIQGAKQVLREFREQTR